VSDNLGAVLGASSMIRTMADGTFRIQVDVEPRFAQQAFALFGAPGTPIALARITNEAAVAEDRKEAEKPKGGALAVLAGRLCQDPEFWAFLTHHYSLEEAVEGPLMAAEQVRQLCGIESRAELDHNPEAEATFHRVIRGPWIKWRARTTA
jgi:hypothetical protein